MKRFIILSFIPILFVIAFNSSACTAQTVIAYYYKDANCIKQMKKENANFQKAIYTDADNTVTTTVMNLKTKEVVKKEAYKGDEQRGIWIHKYATRTDTMNYDFDLAYGDWKCDSTLAVPGVTNLMKDNDTAHYVAPKLPSGVTNLYYIVANKIRYPQKGLEEGIGTKVYLRFTLTETGEVTDITAKKSDYIYFDKEAVRVLRMLRFTSPAMLNGKPVSVCIQFPVTFQLSDE